jgi:hypothetical protein
MLSLYFLKVCINTLEKDMLDGKYQDYNKIFIKTKNIITGEYRYSRVSWTEFADKKTHFMF